jgi:hypothetical protein
MFTLEQLSPNYFPHDEFTRWTDTKMITRQRMLAVLCAKHDLMTIMRHVALLSDSVAAFNVATDCVAREQRFKTWRWSDVFS